MKQLAEFFKKEGIKGLPYSSDNNPIINYLRSGTTFSKDDMDSNPGDVSIILPTCNSYQMTIQLPKVVEQFMNRFDDGKFPDLCG